MATNQLTIQFQSSRTPIGISSALQKIFKNFKRKYISYSSHNVYMFKRKDIKEINMHVSVKVTSIQVQVQVQVHVWIQVVTSMEEIFILWHSRRPIFSHGQDDWHPSCQTHNLKY